MLRRIISILFLRNHTCLVRQILALNDQVPPSCIQIIGNIEGDSTINGWIKQEFTHTEDGDESLWLKYVSRDGAHQFGLVLQQEKWFLTPINSINNKYLKSPAFNGNSQSADASDLTNPLRIGDYGWKRWVSGVGSKEKWDAVTNPINVKNCQPESSQTSTVDSYSTTANLTTTTQTTTVSMTKESVPECIKIKTDLTFVMNNNNDQCEIESILKV